MEIFKKIQPGVKIKAHQILSFLVIFLNFTTLAAASAFNSNNTSVPPKNDTSVKAAIKKILHTEAEMQLFHYPKSIRRFYVAAGFEPVWTNPANDNRKTPEALLMLKCVLQFGLNHSDYHPKELQQSSIENMLSQHSKADPISKARFDLLLSDALIAFINHLHFGKLNPLFSNATIDSGKIAGFCADEVLKHALKAQNFISEVLNVQPKVKAYVLMQDYLKLMNEQHAADCHAAPEGMARKMAINMERLRWAAMDENKLIQINIPSYTLNLFTPDTTYLFKVIVGKPASPTPMLQSSITHFETAPDWKVPKNIFIKELLPKALKNPAYLQENHLAIYDQKGNYLAGVKNSLMAIKAHPEKYSMRQSPGCDNALGLIVFRFQNVFNVYLHDTPEQQLFDRKVRSLSHGCIRVQQAEKLAVTLLKLDEQQHKNKKLHQAMATLQSFKFHLKSPVPLKITYLTCEVTENGVVEYDDVYKKDEALESALFGEASTLNIIDEAKTGI